MTGIATDLQRWAVTHALPFWASTGWDAQRGGFHERLSADGIPDHGADRRLRVQARQIYVYAHAAHLGWYPDGLQVALRGFDYLMDKGHAPDGQPGFVHLLTADGTVANGLRDTYDHMFVLLAATWLARVSGDAQIRAVVDQTLAFIDEELTDAHGTLLEGKPAMLPRRQNPTMHAFEATLALHESLAHPQAIPRAEAFLALFKTSFLDPSTDTVREFFTQNWQPLPPPEGTSVEPGHQAEWAWLLRRHETLTGKPRAPLSSLLLNQAISTADPVTGLLYDEADANGTIRRFTSRTWLQTELSKAWLAETEAGRDGARDKAMAALTTLKQRYLDTAPMGCWVDQLDRQGRVINAPITASTFYHIFAMIAEAERVLGGLKG
jgi:mannose/cellobiose epimerase-like protein (N-acyl-D-glucosamine 2-epimerase family)